MKLTDRPRCSLSLSLSSRLVSSSFSSFPSTLARPLSFLDSPPHSPTSLSQINAGICRDLAKGIAEHCPKAFVLVISNPVNSTVPVFAEVFKAAGTYDAKRWVLKTFLGRDWGKRKEGRER